MLIFGIVVTHLWFVLCVVLYVGYLTYADYYDKLSRQFIYDFKMWSLCIAALMLVVFFVAITDKNKPVDMTLLKMYYGISAVGSIALYIMTIVLFIKNSHNIRKYFGRKRNKI